MQGLRETQRDAGALLAERQLARRWSGRPIRSRQRGFFVAFSYTSDAERECAAFHKRTGRLIKLLTVQEILDEEHVQKM